MLELLQEPRVQASNCQRSSKSNVGSSGFFRQMLGCDEKKLSKFAPPFARSVSPNGFQWIFAETVCDQLVKVCLRYWMRDSPISRHRCAHLPTATAFAEGMARSKLVVRQYPVWFRWRLQLQSVLEWLLEGSGMLAASLYERTHCFTVDFEYKSWLRGYHWNPQRDEVKIWRHGIWSISVVGSMVCAA